MPSHYGCGAVTGKLTTVVITLRAVLVGLTLCLLLAAAEPWGVGVVHGSPLCADYSTGAAIFLFFLLTLANLAWRRLQPPDALRPSELLTIYAMMVTACAIPSWGFAMNLLAIMPGIVYYANPGNRWEALIHPHINQSLIIADPAACRMFYEGLRRGETIPWGIWLRPLGLWFGFALALFLIQILVALLLSRQWISNERLVFPLTQLPMEMAAEVHTSPNRPFFANPLMWAGFAIPLAFHSVNGLHSYYPIVPQLRQGWWINLPRNSTYLAVTIFFEVVGLAYLLSRDVAFSLWLFPLLRTLQVSLSRVTGWNMEAAETVSDPGNPPVAFEGLGAMIVLVALCVWRARNELRDSWQGRPPRVRGAGKLPVQPLIALAVIAVAILWVWLADSGLGPVGAGTVLFFAFFVFVGLTRVVAQGGMAYGRPPVAVPVATVHTLGTDFLGPRGLTALGLTFAWGADVRTMVMASAMNSFKLADSVGLKPVPLVLPLILATVASLGGATFAVMLGAHREGAVTLGGWHMRGLTPCQVSWVLERMNSPSGVRWDRLAHLAIGGGLFLGLSVLRDRFAWFPIHPLGLCLGLAGPFAWVWFSVLLGWIAKVIILRYGGAKAYQRSRVFFLGLITGSFTAAGMWLIIDGVTGHRGNVFTLG